MKHIIKVEVLENLPTIRPVIAMDRNKKFFQEGKKEPVGPANNEIWYTTTDDNKYNLGGIIDVMTGIGATYNGPAIVSNEYDEEKQMYRMTFNRDVTVLGDVDGETLATEGPIFVT